MAVRISKSLSASRDPYGIVSYRGIPLYRVQAWALESVRILKHVEPVIISGIRNDSVIAAHNRKYHTNLHGQQYLVNLFHAGRGNPANSPQTTSHCGYADGNPVYGRAGARIPKIKTGIDAADNATAGRIVRALGSLKIRAALPYHSGSELHHFSLNPKDPGDAVKYIRFVYRRAVAQQRLDAIRRTVKKLGHWTPGRKKLANRLKKLKWVR